MHTHSRGVYIVSLRQHSVKYPNTAYAPHNTKEGMGMGMGMIIKCNSVSRVVSDYLNNSKASNRQGFLSQLDDYVEPH